PDQNSAWVGPCGEIGDACVGRKGTAAGYVVQLEWSNALAGCVDHNPSVKFDDFTLALMPTNPSATPGGSATVAVSATPTMSSKTITLNVSASGLPSGVTAGFSPSSIASNSSSTLTLTVGAAVAAGSYPFSVTAAGSATHSANATLTVQKLVVDMA